MNYEYFKKKFVQKKLDEVNELKKKITFNKSQKFQCRGFLNNLIKENKENYNIIAEIKKEVLQAKVSLEKILI